MLGQNLHLLYPKKEYKIVQKFIKNDLVQFCESQQFINDNIGNGPFKL